MVAWYIPPSWVDAPPVATTIIDAAQLVLNATSNRHLPHTRIPMVVHQTWKNTRIETWSTVQLNSVEKWLEVTLSADMAYFLWDDHGVDQLIRQLEPEWAQVFFSLPVHVEQSDVFRIMLCRHFGGTVSPLSIALLSFSLWT
jgi:mannosyltransferase OCH1-like enzyme